MGTCFWVCKSSCERSQPMPLTLLGLKPATPEPKELKSFFPVEPERVPEEIISTVYLSGPKGLRVTDLLPSPFLLEGRKKPGKLEISSQRMTLNTQQEAKTTLRRRASTPLPLSSRGHQPGRLCTAPATQSQHPRLGQSVSLNPPVRKPSPAQDGWSSESSDSEGSWEALYRVVLLGDPGVGKSSLASLFAEKQERDLHEQLGGRHPGCGHRIEKPVTRSTGLQRTDGQVTHCSTHKGIVHTCYKVNR